MSGDISSVGKIINSAGTGSPRGYERIRSGLQSAQLIARIWIIYAPHYNPTGYEHKEVTYRNAFELCLQ